MAFKLATELGFTPTLTRLKKVVTCQIAVMDVHGPDTPTPRITFWTEAREESMPKTKVRSCETGQRLENQDTNEAMIGDRNQKNVCGLEERAG